LYALWRADTAEVKDLLKKGADPNAQTVDGARPLLIAAKLRNSDLIRILIENGADVNGKDRNGMTPLMAAASMGQAKNAEVLIGAGADLNAMDNNRITALMWATLKGFPDVVKILLARGADVHGKTKEGLTAWVLSKRIIGDIQRQLAEDQKARNKAALSEHRKNLTKHEKVFRLLEEAGGKEPR
jgi:ankyrin repeat protein